MAERQVPQDVTPPPVPIPVQPQQGHGQAEPDVPQLVQVEPTNVGAPPFQGRFV